MVQPVNSQPQIFIHRGVALDEIMRCVPLIFDLPPEHVLVGGFPVGTCDAAYARYFEAGCIELWRVSKGVFGVVLEPFLRDDRMSDERLAALSACLQGLVCVDFSRSDSEPDQIAWIKGARVGRVELFEVEDEDGEPYCLSPEIDALVRN